MKTVPKKISEPLDDSLPQMFAYYGTYIDRAAELSVLSYSIRENNYIQEYFDLNKKFSEFNNKYSSKTPDNIKKPTFPNNKKSIEQGNMALAEKLWSDLKKATGEESEYFISLKRAEIENQSIINSIPFIYDQYAKIGRLMYKTPNRQEHPAYMLEHTMRYSYDNIIVLSLKIAAQKVRIVKYSLENRKKDFDSVPLWNYEPKVYAGEMLEHFLR